MEIGDRIKNVRTSIKLSQDELGNQIGLKKSAISLIESGRNTAQEQTILAICRVYNVNYRWLKTGEGDMFNSEQSDMDKVIDLLLVHEKETAKAVFKALAAMGGDEWAAFKKFILTAAHEIEQSEQTKE